MTTQNKVYEYLAEKNWRISNLYKIVDKFSNNITFTPNKAQLHFQKNKHNRNIVLKSRRLGFTTYSVLDMLDNTLFNKNFNSLFISYDDPSSKKVFDEIAMLAWENFPLKSSYQIDLSNANMLKVDLGKKTFSQIEIKSSGRGGRNNQIHISEFAKICAKYPNKAKEIISGTLPSLVPNGEVTFESTAEGETGLFYTMFWQAVERLQSNLPLMPHEYKPHFYNWQWDEQELALITQPDIMIPKDFRDYQQQHNEKALLLPHLYQHMDDIMLTYWHRKFVELGSNWNILKQEYPVTMEEAFVSSGNKLFDSKQVEWQKQFVISSVKIGDWEFYDLPKPNHIYVIGADPSEGVGSDHSAAVILDLSTRPRFRVVATYKNNRIMPDMFAYELRNQGMAFNYASIMVERNNMGHATLTELKHIYPAERIYREEKDTTSETEETERLGWHTNLATKPRMFSDLSTGFNDHSLEIPSQALQNEARIYDRSKLLSTKADPEATNHFDLLTALAIAFQGRTANQINPLQVTTYTPPPSKNFDPFAGA